MSLWIRVFCRQHSLSYSDAALARLSYDTVLVYIREPQQEATHVPHVPYLVVHLDVPETYTLNAKSEPSSQSSAS